MQSIARYLYLNTTSPSKRTRLIFYSQPDYMTVINYTLCSTNAPSTKLVDIRSTQLGNNVLTLIWRLPHFNPFQLHWDTKMMEVLFKTGFLQPFPE